VVAQRRNPTQYLHHNLSFLNTSSILVSGNIVLKFYIITSKGFGL